ncbi:hypothetical protein FRB95_010149 [Tulasnella sp. JGI-2019a]|nr:hypothetical protein FRB95_010149 [Tulasnella sp. JGI-2019a]
MPYTILVGGYSNVITTLSFDPTTSPVTLKVIGTSPSGPRPSWIAPHPTDKSLIFASNEQVDGKVQLFKFKPDHITLDLIQTAWSGGAAPCHLHVSEHEVFTANFSSGTVHAIPLSVSPPALLAPRSQPIHFEFPGIGPKPNQEWSHPHQVFPDPSGKVLLVPDLGSDKIWRLARDEESESWKVKDTIEVTRGSGLRHVVFQGDDLYVINELASTVTHHSYPAEGKVQEVKTLSGLKSSDQLADNMLGAALLLARASASFPIPLIYASNRNDPHPEGDTIAIFKPKDASSGFELIGEVRMGLHHIRAVALGGEEDRYLVIGGLTGGSNLPHGVRGGGIKVFERVEGGRSLNEVAHLGEEHVEQPTAFIVL